MTSFCRAVLFPGLTRYFAGVGGDQRWILNWFLSGKESLFSG